MVQTFERGDDQSVKDHLGIGAAQTAGVEMTTQEMQHPKVRSDQVMSCLLLLN